MTRRQNLLFLVAVTIVSATDFQVKIPTAGTRCFGEELQAHDLLVVRAESVINKDINFTMIIKNSVNEGSHKYDVSGGGREVYREEKKNSVSHAFTATLAGPHWVCISNLDASKDLDILVTMKSGVAAKDYSKIAKKEHLEPSQVAMRRIDDMLNEYRGNLFYQRRREERMRETVDSTADRALAFCLFNGALIVVVGLLQAYYFRRFFRSKKII